MLLPVYAGGRARIIRATVVLARAGLPGRERQQKCQKQCLFPDYATHHLTAVLDAFFARALLSTAAAGIRSHRRTLHRLQLPVTERPPQPFQRAETVT